MATATLDKKSFPMKGFMPDFAPHQMPEGGLLQCSGVIPGTEGFLPWYAGIAQTSGAIGERSTYAQNFEYLGTNRLIVGTPGDLWRKESNDTWTEVSKLATTYSQTTLARWHFEQYGNWVVATNYNNNPQVLKDYIAGTNFVDLGGGPPLARYCLMDNGHLILGNFIESGVYWPKALYWSAHEDIEKWVRDLQTGCDSQNFPEAYGEITGLAHLGAKVAVFHQNSITLGQYVGSPFTFQFLPNSVRNIGALPNTVITVGNTLYFFDDHNIYEWQGGSGYPTPIGFGVNEWLISNLNKSYLNRITTAQNEQLGIVMWSFVAGSSYSSPNTILIYNYFTKSFSIVSLDIDHLATFYKGSGDTIGYMGIDKKLYYQGTNCLESVLETGDFQIESDIMSVKEVRGLIYGPASGSSAPTCKIGTRMSEATTSPTYSTVMSPSNGKFDARSTGRYFRVYFRTTGNYSIIPYRFEMSYVRSGGR